MATTFTQNSRFACLSIDDDEESDDQTQNKQPNKSGVTSAAAKKRNRKKKKAAQAENAELRELAFAMGGSAKTKKPPQASTNVKRGVGSGDSEQQWNEWRKVDEEFTNEKYESDLQQAILQSKLDFEKNEELKVTGGDVNDESKDGKKKKKKKKAAMSLEEFSHFDENKEPDEPLISEQPKSPSAKVVNADTDFFDRVEKDASKTIMKEKIQEEYTKQYIVQNARTAHYEKELNKKDKEIIMLRATVEKLKEEALDAKQRNQQLCNILAQGEMKDKASVLQNLEELNQVKNELMDEINRLTAELEKEKSKSHSLKTELERYQSKSSKHK